MKSGLRRLLAKGPPVPAVGGAGRWTRGLSFNLGVGRQDRETQLRQYGMSGTLYGIISLLAEASATPRWHVYQKAPVDGRRRYATGDQGSDQRREMIGHPAFKLWDKPNDFHSGFEFREGSQQHEEITGETFWVVDKENFGIPTAMWYVRPDRMEPVPDPDDYLIGWIYTGPNGENVPLKVDEVILEKRPDPLDPYRGLGPVAAIMPNIQQQRYATEYQRNLFLNGANPGGIITVPNKLSDVEFDELVERWREGHRGVARAGHVGVLENGASWTAEVHTNKDMEYGALRLANRDELREAWRIHKSMMGTSDDVNRANAQTAQEVFVAWQTIPRLNRRRDTLNTKLLPLFGSMGQGVEFDYEDPSPENAENAAAELMSKATAAQALVSAGYDPHDVLEVVGLPDMEVGTAAPAAPLPPDIGARETIRIITERGYESEPRGLPARVRNDPTPVYIGAPRVAGGVPQARGDAAGKAYESVAEDFPASALAWMHHAAWTGPLMVPLDHIDDTPLDTDPSFADRTSVFIKKLDKGKKLKPVILVKTPSGDKLKLIDGHHRYYASASCGHPVRAFIGTVDADAGPWDEMHGQQYPATKVKPDNSAREMAQLLQRVLSDGYVPVEVGSRDAWR